MNQPACADSENEGRKRRTRREVFQERMEGLFPCTELEPLLQLHQAIHDPRGLFRPSLGGLRAQKPVWQLKTSPRPMKGLIACRVECNSAAIRFRSRRGGRFP